MRGRRVGVPTLVLVLFMTAQAPLFSQEVCATPWRLHETLRIGSVDGPDALNSVWDVELGPQGDLYVTQYFTPRVTVFGPDGQLKRTIGRAGQGPGEFDFAAMHLGWSHDTLWVSDGSALHFLRADGTEIRQVRFDTRLLDQGSRFRSGIPLADGTFLGVRGLTGNIPAFYAASTVAIPRLAANGEILDTIARVRQLMRVRSGDQSTRHPLDDGWGGLPFTATVDGSALLLVDQAPTGRLSPNFTLVKVGVGGDTLFHRTIEYAPRPVSRADRNWLTEMYGNYMAGDYESGSNWMPRSDAVRERARRQWRDAIEYPGNFPPVRQIIAGHDGSIWLLRELALPEMVDQWEIYDATGALMGTVLIREGHSLEVPWYPRMKVLRTTTDELWGTTIDDLGVSYIHRYEVDRTCG